MSNDFADGYTICSLDAPIPPISPEQRELARRAVLRAAEGRDATAILDMLGIGDAA